MHTNSFTSDRLPVYGVETIHEATLGAMLNDVNTWGIDIFKIGTLSCNRPLTCVAYQIFQVSHNFYGASIIHIWSVVVMLLISASTCVCGKRQRGSKYKLSCTHAFKKIRSRSYKFFIHQKKDFWVAPLTFNHCDAVELYVVPLLKRLIVKTSEIK
jgi:hypothetical protein